MAVTATYHDDFGRIRLEADTLGAAATYAVFDRTLDDITYTTLRGGTDVAVSAGAAHIDDYEFPVGVAVTYRVRSFDASDVLQAAFTVTVTQALDDPWLKSIQRPFLNHVFAPAEASDVTHLNRSQVFPIVGRSFGVAVTDIGAGLQYELTVATLTEGDAADLLYLVTSGDTLFIQAQPGFPAPVGYFTVGDVRETRQTLPWERRWFTLPLTSVAQPGPDVISTTYTWATVLDDYATWTSVIADNATWADLLEKVGSPEDVIVP